MFMAVIVAFGAGDPARALECQDLGPGQFFVSRENGASDDNDGSCGAPFSTIRHGLRKLGPGKTLNLRGGVYLTPVVVNGERSGTKDQHATIRAYPGERVAIDASLPRFRTLADGRWEPAKATDPQAHPQEYVSSDPLTARISRGAFVDRVPYTRLITYTSLRDLRAVNGYRLVNGPRVPTYMGPGLWFDEETRKVHVRLSHTHNGVPGLKDYGGTVDPRKVRLALSSKDQVALQVSGASYVDFEGLDFRGGDDVTVRLQNVAYLTFDHVGVSSTTHGVRTSNAASTTFVHCRFLGGLPEWFFRSDIKAGDGPGAQTSRALLVGAKDDTHTTIEHSELRDGHDLYLTGSHVNIHHNWIDNMNDEALLLDAREARWVSVHENVITRSLSAVSFAGVVRGGPRRVYRNLIDLRQPTAGNRPRMAHDTGALRYGHLFKSNPPDGPLDLFQNTILVSSQSKLQGFFQLRPTRDSARRRSLNNIFVGVRRPGAAAQPILAAWPRTPQMVSDGNAYFRVGIDDDRVYRTIDPERYFQHIWQLLQATGYEQHGSEGPPGFRSLVVGRLPRATDDFRLAPSPVSHAGIPLPPPLDGIDPFDRPDFPSPGAYGADGSRLLVGVEGRRMFPRL
jgi:hypothetical protein